ncbi:TPR repeat-containing protein [Mycobacteroides abscessus subsp. abscessus]|nr:TPR repeat-containing protein [Mycobacteroides abscessus subsp. abscessus]
MGSFLQTCWSSREPTSEPFYTAGGTQPRTTPSGRVNREDADALFATVKAEVEAEPDDWVGWYRLARAYDYAGDRGRARDTMRTAVQMQQDAAR